MDHFSLPDHAIIRNVSQGPLALMWGAWNLAIQRFNVKNFSERKRGSSGAHLPLHRKARPAASLGVCFCESLASGTPSAAVGGPQKCVSGQPAPDRQLLVCLGRYLRWGGRWLETEVSRVPIRPWDAGRCCVEGHCTWGFSNLFGHRKPSSSSPSAPPIA